MSFFHKFIVVYLDEKAIENRQILIKKPINIAQAAEMLLLLGEQISDNEYEVDGDIVRLKNGYLICPIYNPRYNKARHDFVKEFAIEQNCLVADIEHAHIIEPPNYEC